MAINRFFADISWNAGSSGYTVRMISSRKYQDADLKFRQPVRESVAEP